MAIYCINTLPILQIAGFEAESTATTGSPNIPPPEPVWSCARGITDLIPKAASLERTPT